MKSKLFTIILLMVNVIFSFTLTACGSNDSQEPENQKTCENPNPNNTNNNPEPEDQEACENPYPSRLDEMIKSWKEAKEYAEPEWDRVNEDYTKCLEECDNETRGCTLEEIRNCSDTLLQESRKVDKEYVKRVNKIPLEVCNTKVQVATESGPRVVFEEDADGDGLSNAYEFFREIDPCNPYSTESQKLSCTNDGALDFDGDGISNAQDPYPDCHGECG